MNLSKNFTLTELTKSSLALRHGLANRPSKVETANMVILAENILQPVRDHFGIAFSPSSGYRSAVVNRLAGSKPSSQHRSGQAVDFEVPGISNLVLHNWIKDNLDVDQNILEFYDGANPNSGWCHVSFVSLNGNRNMSFMIK